MYILQDLLEEDMNFEGLFFQQETAAPRFQLLHY